VRLAQESRKAGQWFIAALVFGGGWFSVAAPQLLYLSGKDSNTLLGLLAPEIFADQANYVSGLLRSLLALHNPNLVTQHFLAAPLAGTLGAMTYFIGLALSVIGWRQRRNQYLLLWFGLTLLVFSAATGAAPHDRNLVALLPLLALWSGAGLVALLDAAQPLTSVLPARAAQLALVAVTVIVAGAGLYDYFYRVPQAYHPDFENIIGWAGLNAQGTRFVYVYGDPTEANFMPYVLREFSPHLRYETVSVDALIQHQIEMPADQPVVVFYPLAVDNAAIAASSTYWPILDTPTVFHDSSGAGIGGAVMNQPFKFETPSLLTDSYPRPIWLWLSLLILLMVAIYFFRRDWLGRWPRWTVAALEGLTAPTVELPVEDFPAPMSRQPARAAARRASATTVRPATQKVTFMLDESAFSQAASETPVDSSAQRVVGTTSIPANDLSEQIAHIQLAFDLRPGAHIRVTIESLPEGEASVVVQPSQSNVQSIERPLPPTLAARPTSAPEPSHMAMGTVPPAPQAVPLQVAPMLAAPIPKLAIPAIKLPKLTLPPNIGARVLAELQDMWRDWQTQIRTAWTERQLQVTALAASPVFAYLAGRAAGDGELANSPLFSIGFWLMAIGLGVYGSWRGVPRGWRLSWATWLWLAGLTVVALIVRGWNLAHIPVILTGDEGSSGLSAMRFVDGKANNWFSIGWYSFPSLYFWIQSIPLHFLGPTITGLRLSSAIAGALTVGGLYLLGRVMYGHRVGLVAAILLTGFHFHIHFSRIALNNIWDGLGYVVVLGAFWHGWKNNTRGSFVLAGVWLGLAQYFYPSGRTLIVVIAAWLFIAVFLDWPRLRQNLPSIGLMFGLGFVVFLPLAFFFIRHPADYMAPINRVTLLGPWLENEVKNTGHPAWQILAEQIKMGFEAYTQIPLRVWYAPGTPLIRMPEALFFWGGLLLLLRRYRDGQTWLLALWLIATGLTGGLSESTPAAQRYVAAAPVAVLVIAYALVEGGKWLLKFQPRFAVLAGPVAFVLAIGLSLADAQFYFSDYTPRTLTDGSFGGDNTWVAHKLGFYLQSKSSDWQVFFFGVPRMGYLSIPSLPFLAQQITGFDVTQPWGSPDNPQPTSSHLIFVFLPGFDQDRGIVEANYPGGRWLQENMPDGRPLYWLYEYEGESLPPVSVPTPAPTPAPVDYPAPPATTATSLPTAASAPYPSATIP
jgi:4-amino-4-deoxy-L-arabinose transferase-like glycosyltransferase